MTTNIDVSSEKYSTLMYYHTALRNVGLFTSVSFASLAYAAKLKADKHRLLGLFLHFSSLVFLLIAAAINYNLYMDIKRIVKKHPSLAPAFAPWLNVTFMVFPVHLVMLITNIATITNSIYNMK
jgi:hypothetical protein